MSQEFGGDRTGAKQRVIPEATVARLAAYLRALTVMSEVQFATSASSDELATAAGVNSATLRKDLSYLGTYGIRGVGYDIELLTAEIGRALGAHHAHRVALVGVGNLGAALAGYSGFVSRGLAIGALFDVDPNRVGSLVGGLIVENVDRIVAVCEREGITIGVIATPGPAAQSAADALVGAGVRSILAFTPGIIVVPADVTVRTVDLAVELQILAFHETRKAVGEPAPGVGTPPAGVQRATPISSVVLRAAGIASQVIGHHGTTQEQPAALAGELNPPAAGGLVHPASAGDGHSTRSNR